MQAACHNTLTSPCVDRSISNCRPAPLLSAARQHSVSSAPSVCSGNICRSKRLFQHSVANAGLFQCVSTFTSNRFGACRISVRKRIQPKVLLLLMDVDPLRLGTGMSDPPIVSSLAFTACFEVIECCMASLKEKASTSRSCRCENLRLGSHHAHDPWYGRATEHSGFRPRSP
ncbi:MAG: hypothetical protein ACI9VR_003747 [Cognaticolwellia sp.]|jgi:hypothetical protein